MKHSRRRAVGELVGRSFDKTHYTEYGFLDSFSPLDERLPIMDLGFTGLIDKIEERFGRRVTTAMLGVLVVVVFAWGIDTLFAFYVSSKAVWEKGGEDAVIGFLKISAMYGGSFILCLIGFSAIGKFFQRRLEKHAERVLQELTEKRERVLQESTDESERLLEKCEQIVEETKQIVQEAKEKVERSGKEVRNHSRKD